MTPLPGTVIPEPDLATRYSHGPDWVRGNMVMSLDGRVTVDGRVGPLTGDADQRVLVALRQLADVVLVGAGTVRAEGYGPLADPAWADARDALGLAAEPRLAIVSNSAHLAPDAPVFADGHRPLLVVPGATAVDEAIRDRCDVLRAGDHAVDLDAALTALRERGLGRILTEGGPTLLGDLIAADLLDELCLTIAPLLVGGAGRSLADLARRAEFQAVDAWCDRGYAFVRSQRP